MHALDVADVSVTFGTRKVLSEVSLSLDRGESVALVGPSGSGKTTLLRCILGAQRPDGGRITVAGTPISGLPDAKLRALRAKHIGMVFQHGELLSELTPLENVALPLLIRGVERDEAEQASHAMLTDLGVPAEETSADQLSGGERQRTALARALVSRPTLVLADEPTGALDFARRDEVTALVVEWCQRFDSALLLVTHDPAVAAQAERVVEISDGRLAPRAGSSRDDA